MHWYDEQSRIEELFNLLDLDNVVEYVISVIDGSLYDLPANDDDVHDPDSYELPPDTSLEDFEEGIKTMILEMKRRKGASDVQPLPHDAT